MVFRIASSPYTHNQRQTSRIMLLVLIAALPGIAAQTWFFWLGNAFPDRSGWLSRRSSQKPLSFRLRKQSVASHLQDYSALLTGLLLAVSIPPACALVDGRAGNRIRHYYR
ncbi:Electron transport complex protein RnfD [Salmonella sp. NCTC 11881]|nr:Electron transport complex protein RnfD [Salmonella sp. NCTC 11881]